MKNTILPEMLLSALGTVLALAVWTGCGNAHDDHNHPHGEGHEHARENDTAHAPPHGGTPVLIAEDKFHLELVADATTGKLSAYVLDGHLEDYVAVSEAGFQLNAKNGNVLESLEFQANRRCRPFGSIGTFISI